MPGGTLPADPSDPTSEPGVALDAVANPTANDIVASGFQGLSNAAPADVAAMNSAQAQTNSNANMAAANVLGGPFDTSTPGWDQDAAVGTVVGAPAGVIASAQSPAGRVSQGFEDVGYGTPAPAQVAMDQEQAASVNNPNSNYNTGLLQDANEMGFTGTPSPGVPGVPGSPAQTAQATPGFFGSPSPGFAQDQTGGFTGVGLGGVGLGGVGFGGNSTDASVGPGTGYGGNAVGYGGDIAGGLGTGFGTGTGPDSGLGLGIGIGIGLGMSGGDISGATGAEDAGDAGEGGSGDGSGGDSGK
jgi:hypothetical protein